jgi:mono/diheme cytochrome c family protein
VLVLLTLVKPARLHLAYGLTIMLSALGTMGAFEFVREAIRKPFVIANYLYDNSLYATPSATDGGFSVEAIDQAGVLNTARWVRHREPGRGGDVGAGREIFRVECQSCHTADAYRGMRRLLTARQWDATALNAMLNSLDLMHNGVMSPFAGTDAERAALGSYLATLYQAGAPPSDGQHLFEENCSVCHEASPGDSAVATIRAMDSQKASDSLTSLPDLFVRMPDLKLTEQQRITLVQWIKTQVSAAATMPQHSVAAETARR